MNPKNVILTGSTGFVGANLLRQLLADGHNLHLFVRKNFQDWRIQDLLPHIQIHIVDLCDPPNLLNHVRAARPDWVFHLAAYGAYPWQPGLQQAVQTNLRGTVELVEACRRSGFESFIHTGSSSEYGAKDRATTEEDAPQPNSDYAVAKASATMFCRYAARRFKLPIFTLRLYSVYGPYEQPGRLIPNLIVQGLQGQLPPLVHPAVSRDMIYTEDVVRACLTVAASGQNLPPGEIYNVGSGQQISINEMVQITRQHFQISAEPIWGSMPNRSWDTETWQANNQRLRSLGWQPLVDFRAGYLKTIEWFRQLPNFLKRKYNLP
jgi:nucleoside-diphosphate-sugar epimerase